MHEEDRAFTIKAGQTLLLWPGKRHGGTTDYPIELEFYWVHFDVPDDAQVKKARHAASLLAVSQAATPARAERLAELFHQFLHEQEEPGGNPLTRDLLLMLMLCEMAHGGIAPASATAGTALAARAQAFIAANFYRDIHAALIADHLDCNPDYLGRIFLRAYSQTITQCIQAYRIGHAKKLLRDSSLSIEQIVRQCGFADPAYFRRIFRRVAGITPGTFRKLHSRVHINMI